MIICRARHRATNRLTIIGSGEKHKSLGLFSFFLPLILLFISLISASCSTCNMWPVWLVVISHAIRFNSNIILIFARLLFFVTNNPFQFFPNRFRSVSPNSIKKLFTQSLGGIGGGIKWNRLCEVYFHLAEIPCLENY